jgi:hypothetical protein
MTEKQEKAIRIVYNLIENCYITQDEFMVLLDAMLEKETYIPGLYPNDVRIREFQDFDKPRLKPGDTHGVEQPKLWDQIVYTYNTTNTTSTTDVNSNVTDVNSGENQIQMICEKNPVKPIEWEDNEF